MVWSAGATLTAAQLNTYLPQDWTAYVPTFSGGGTIGNASRSGEYIQYGKTVHFWAEITLGSTSAISGSLSISLPVAVASGTAWDVNARFGEAGANYYFGRGLCTSSSVTVNVVGTNGAAASTSSTNPFTWVTSDEIYVSGTYKAA